MCNHVLYSVIFRDFFVALSITRSYLGLTATSQSIFWNLNCLANGCFWEVSLRQMFGLLTEQGHF